MFYNKWHGYVLNQDKSLIFLIIQEYENAYGTNYLDRATIAYVGLGANAPEDAIYQMAFTDSSKAALSGTNHYVIHFSQHEIPPVNGFWSVSLYGMDGFSVPNAMNRYSLGDRNMHFNSDGSLDIYVQHDAPLDKDKISNWLACA